MILEYRVKEKNKTINQILQEQFGFSNRLFNKLIKGKNILLNGVNVDTRLKANMQDKITIDLTYAEDNSNIVSRKMDLDIIYEDDGMLVLNKPAGIAIHPSIRHYEDSLASGVKYYFESKGIYKKIRPVNRLDLDTSGLVVFAKNEYIQENLIRQMKDKLFIKEYVALVTGILEPENGIINAPIARKEESIIERCVSETGQNAITEYEVLRKYDNYCLIKCKLITGRTHQIRVHMAYIGHPLLGDTLYGTSSDLIKRQALYCFKIGFKNPVTNEDMEFILDLPSDFPLSSFDV